MRFFFIFVLLSTGCATLPHGSRVIAISDIRNLKVGQASKAEVESLLGKPQQIVLKFKPNEVWIYKTPEGNQTASVAFNENSSLIGAVWVAASDKDAISLQKALSLFQQSKFKVQKEGWDKQGHFYSDDAYYRDERNEISFTVNAHDQSVTTIAFGASELRTPANQPR